MTALIISPEKADEIRAAVARAREEPVPWEALEPIAVTNASPVLRLEDREEDHFRPPAQTVLIPMAYRLCVSFERQPAGLLAHFSISVERKGFLPNRHAVTMIVEAAGFQFDAADAQWLEEFAVDGEPGGLAINLAFLVEPAGPLQ